MKLKSQSAVFKITLLALNLALYIGLSFASVNLQFTVLSLTGIPVIFAAVVYGPVEGVLVGLVGEFIVQLATYGLMPTTPLWLLAPVARGLIVGFMFKHKNVKKHMSLWILTVLVSTLAVTLLNTIAIVIDDIILYEAPQLTLFRTVFRFVGSVISSVIYIFLVPTLFQPLIKQGKFEDEDVAEPTVKEVLKDKKGKAFCISSACVFAFSLLVLIWTLFKFNLVLVIIYLVFALLYSGEIIFLEKKRK